MSAISTATDRIPAHLMHQEPKVDPVFRDWLERRNREAGQHQGSSKASQEFMERIASLCEERKFQRAFEHYDRYREQLEATAELLEFDQMIGNIRHQLRIIECTVA
jgi:CRISPR/Cas system-associated protein Csm6